MNQITTNLLIALTAGILGFALARIIYNKPKDVEEEDTEEESSEEDEEEMKQEIEIEDVEGDVHAVIENTETLEEEDEEEKSTD